MALALRSEAPIYVAETVLEQAGVVPEEAAEPPASGEPASGVDDSKLAPFREFIESLEMDDLGGSTGQS